MTMDMQMFLRSTLVRDATEMEENGNKKWAGNWLPGLFVPPHSEADVQEVRKFKFKRRFSGGKGSAFVNVKD